MDRRGNPETAEHQDEHLQRALDVILESYRGGAPERLYRDAIVCFEDLIEISQNTESIKDFAHRRGIDLKYLVDGANFVISRMHFNAGNNYYITLGLPRNAHHDEVRERWKRLMFLYHPDRQTGNEDWVSERAKKVNEAYSVLKDEQKRSAFDRQLVEAATRQEQGFPVPDHFHATEKSRVMHARSRSGASGGPVYSMRKYFTKMLVAFYLLCMLVAAVLVFSRDRTPDIESQLRADERASQPRITRGPETGPVSKDVTVPSAPERREESFFDSLDRYVKTGPAGSRQERLQGEKTAVSGSRTNAGPGVSRGNDKPGEVRRAVPLPGKDVSAGEASRREQRNNTADVSPGKLLHPLLPQFALTARTRTDDAVPAEQKKEVPARGDTSQAAKAPSVAEKTEVKPVQEARAGAGAAGRVDAATRDEVAEFIRRFLAAYEKGDLDLMMSFFSQSAVENNTFRYPEIRKAYRNAFDGKINYYHLRDMHIRVDGPAAYVTGSFTIDRYNSADDRWLKFSGRISWNLVREHGTLKIVSLNYDR